MLVAAQEPEQLDANYKYCQQLKKAQTLSTPHSQATAQQDEDTQHLLRADIALPMAISSAKETLMYIKQEILPDQNAHLAGLVPAYNLFFEVGEDFAGEGVSLSNDWYGAYLAYTGIHPDTQKRHYIYLNLVCCTDTELVEPHLKLVSLRFDPDHSGARSMRPEDEKILIYTGRQSIIDAMREFQLHCKKLSRSHA